MTKGSPGQLGKKDVCPAPSSDADGLVHARAGIEDQESIPGWMQRPSESGRRVREAAPKAS